MNVEERKLEVLRAIVEDFIATNEPVGSKAIVDRHNLGVSPATIRNDTDLDSKGIGYELRSADDRPVIGRPRAGPGSRPRCRRREGCRPAPRPARAPADREAR